MGGRGRRIAACAVLTALAAAALSAAVGRSWPPGGGTRRALLASPPRGILEALRYSNGTCGVVWTASPGGDLVVTFSGLSGIPEGARMVLAEVGTVLIPSGSHVEVLGVYRAPGTAIPWGEVPGRLMEVPVPAGVERYEVAADGVRLLYVYENGFPAVLSVGGRPEIVLIAANLTEWLSEDPAGAACLVRGVLDSVSPVGGGMAPLAAGLGLGGAAALLAGLGMGELGPGEEAGREPEAGPLAHPTRAVLFALIRDAGAASLGELSSRLGLPRSTLAYHLSVLEREGLLSSEDLVGEKMFFPPGGREGALLRAAVRSRTRRRILESLAGEGPASIRGLASRLGLSTETVKRNVDLLERFGLVVSERVGRRRVVSLPPAGEAPGPSGTAGRRRPPESRPTRRCA